MAGGRVKLASEGERSLTHKALHVAVIIITFLLTVLVIIFALLFMGGTKNGLFEHSLSQLRELQQTDVLPSAPMCPLAFVVYGWQALWTVYSVTTIWRQSAGGYLYLSPYHLPLLVSLAYSAGLLLKLAWFFLWDREQLVAAVAVQAGAALCVSVAGAGAMWGLARRGRELLRQGRWGEVVVTRLLVHNGLSLLSSWHWVQVFIDVSVVASEQGSLQQRDASSLALGLTGAALLLTFLLHDLYLDTYARYVFSPYLVVLGQMSCLLAHTWDADSRNSVLALVVALLAAVLLLLKVGLVVRRGLVQPEPLLLPHDDRTETTVEAKSSSTKAVKKEHIDGVISLPPPPDPAARLTSSVRLLHTPAPPASFLSAPPRPAALEVLNLPGPPTGLLQPHDTRSTLTAPPLGLHPAPPPLLTTQPLTLEPVAMTTPPELKVGSLRGTPVGVLHVSRDAFPVSRDSFPVSHDVFPVSPAVEVGSVRGVYLGELGVPVAGAPPAVHISGSQPSVYAPSLHQQPVYATYSTHQPPLYATNSMLPGYPLDTRSNLI